MKKGNDSTNKILIGCIFFLLLIFFYLFGKSNYVAILPHLFTSKETLLTQRYNSLVALGNERKSSEIFDNYLDDSMKNAYSGGKDAFISNSAESPYKKTTSKINKVTLNGDIGYIERTSTSCKDDGCSDNNVLTNYSVWKYHGGNWYMTNEHPLCIRQTTYDMRPEFQRAISLIKQRLDDTYKDSIDTSFLNCVEIEYGDVGDAEGVFTFDENNSNIERLTIKVDKSYASSDDLLTAFLLAHETTHAYDYLDKIEYGTNLDCVELEKRAFFNQLLFGGIINQEERDSINSRLRTDFGNYSNQLEIISTISLLEMQAQRICGTTALESGCTTEKTLDLLENMIKANPYYQKQCNL